MSAIHIYTTSNWLLIRHLWPTGEWHNGKYLVYADSDSDEYLRAIAKLRLVSPYLADQVAVWSTTNALVFDIHCARDVAKPHWPIKRGSK